MFVGAGGLPLDEASAELCRIVKLGLEFKNRERFYSPAEGLSPAEVMGEPLPRESTPLEDVEDALMKSYLPGMPNFGSPRFLGFPDAGNNLVGIAGAILADLLNVNLINSTFCSRIATEMEIAVIRWLRELIGYPAIPLPDSATGVGGAVLSGGTMCNYAAVLIARERAFPDTLKCGVRFDTARVKVIVPEGIGHYTIPASLAWAGLGSENVLRCPISNFRYDQHALRTMLRKCSEGGLKIIMVTAYAGDSRTMTIEDLRGVHDLLREIDPSIWLHCDGCHGTSLCFSESLKHKLAGIELWDSVSLDPHKVLSVPYPLSILLVKEPKSLAAVLSESDLIMRQHQSLGQVTPVLGSKAFHSLRLWLLMKVMGSRGIGQIIEDRCEKAAQFAELLEDHPRFVVLNDVSINSVVFLYVPEGIRPPVAIDIAARVSRLNRLIYERILAEGEFYVHSFIATDNLNKLGLGSDYTVNALRYMSGNPLATESVFRDVLVYLAELGKQCWA